MNPNQQFKRIVGEYVSGLHIMIFACIILGTGIVLLTVRSFISIAKPTESAPAPIANVAAAPSDGATRMAVYDSAIAESIEQERRNAARVELTAFRERLTQALKQLDDFDTELNEWDSEIATLLTSDDGRLLAADERSIDAFASLYAIQRPGKEDVAARRGRIQMLLQPVESALNGNSTPVPPQEGSLKALESEMTLSSKELYQQRDARETIKGMLAAARAVDRKAEATLAKAMEDLNARRAKTLADRIAEVRQRVDAERQDKLVELEERKAREIANAEVQRREANLEAQRQAVVSETHQAEEKAELARLKKLAEDPAIQANYKPFLSKGAYRLGLPTGTGYQHYKPPKPVSYNDVVRLGILNDVAHFVSAGAGTGQYDRQDRPRWPEPKTETEWKEYQRRLDEFKQLAPIWRDMGLLQP